MSTRLEAPIFSIRALPDNEREAGICIQQNLVHLTVLVDELRMTMRLYEFATNSRSKAAEMSDDMFLFQHWSILAAKAGAITLEGVSEIMHSFGASLLRQCPTIGGVVDVKKRRAVDNLFKEKFPNITLIRHDAAHPESLSTPHKREANSVKSAAGLAGISLSDSSISISGGMNNGDYITTHGRQVSSYRPGLKCADDLTAVIGQFLGLFEEAAKITKEILSERKK